jgi:CheY-like chemotaxis protein
VPPEPLDALENLPKEAPRQGAFGELQGEVPGMSDEPRTGLEEPLARPAGESDARRGTVLYIEDNPSNLRLVEQVVAERPGVRLITAMQGRLGLDLARQHRPDLILLDLHLPDLPGDEVLRELRGDPVLGRTPVVILSADATPGRIERLRAAGASTYLTKPIDVWSCSNAPAATCARCRSTCATRISRRRRSTRVWRRRISRRS